MRLNLKATSITLSDDIRGYLDKKLASLSKFLDLEDEAVVVAVELGRSTKHHQSGEVFYAEISVYRGKESWRAAHRDVTLMAAIDGMRDEIAGELVAAHGKNISIMRRSGLAAKELLRYGAEGVGYMSRPAKAGWKYVRRMWRK